MSHVDGPGTENSKCKDSVARLFCSPIRRRSERIVEDEVTEASGSSGSHIIVVPQIQTILKLGGNGLKE